MADIIVSNLRGGLNNTDPANAIADNQCAVARNIEWTGSAMGERRRGTVDVDMPAGLSSHDNVWWLFRHLPTDDDRDSELWALGTSADNTYALYRKTTAWSAVTLGDDWNIGTDDYPTSRWSAVSLHGKLFFTYPADDSKDPGTDLNRIFVWDGSAVRRVGLDAPTFDIEANAIVGNGTYVGKQTGKRYYRIRYTKMSGSTVLLRSEPCDEVVEVDQASFESNGIIIISVSDAQAEAADVGATHIELEGSRDNANWYTISSTAVSSLSGIADSLEDSHYRTASYADDFELSADVGDYTIPPAAKILLADEDRLIMIGHWTDANEQARVRWTPVGNADGVGNDERLELDTDPYLDLDTFYSGELAGAVKCFGDILVFFSKRVYRLRRTGIRSRAYEIVEEKNFGAVPESIVVGTDSAGNECVYFFDPMQGPCRYTEFNVMPCGADVRRTWKAINLDAALPCVAYYYPRTRQVHFNFAITEDADNTVTGPATETEIPYVGLVLHTQNTVDASNGIRGGWAKWDGKRVRTTAATLYASNIDDNVARSRTLVPFIGIEEANLSGVGQIQRTDTGTDDDGLVYFSNVLTKAFAPGNWIRNFGIMAGVLVLRPISGAEVIVQALRDFGLETLFSQAVSSSPSLGSETQVIEPLDDLKVSGAKAVQFNFTDNAPNYTRWELTAFAAKVRNEESM
jgi:hypothetical protein